MFDVDRARYHDREPQRGSRVHFTDASNKSSQLESCGHVAVELTTLSCCYCTHAAKHFMQVIDVPAWSSKIRAQDRTRIIHIYTLIARSTHSCECLGVRVTSHLQSRRRARDLTGLTRLNILSLILTSCTLSLPFTHLHTCFRVYSAIFDCCTFMIS